MIHILQSIENNPLLKIQLKVMRYYGLVLFDDQRFHFVHKFRGFLVMLIFTVFSITQFVDLYQAIGDLDKITTNAASTLLIVIVVAQCYEFLYYRSDLTTVLLNEIDANINKIRNFAGNIREEHRRNISNILTENIQNSNLLTLAFAFSTVMGGTMLNSLSYWKYSQVAGLSTDEQKNANWLMIRSWYPVDIYENFVPIYIHQLIVCYTGTILLPLIQTLVVVFMIHAIAMLQILKLRCQSITDDIELYERSIENRDMMIKQKLRDCVTTHLEIGRFVQNLDKLISSSMLFIFAVFSVLLCSLLFRLSKMEFGVTAFTQLVYIFNMIFTLLLFYWHANEVAYHSSNLPNSIYFCNWYMCSKKIQQLLLIFMMGSQRPMTLSAMYFKLNLDTLINILTASYSYFTLLTHITNSD